MFLSLVPVIGAGVLGSASGPEFRVSFDGAVRAEPATGRLVVYLLREGANVGDDAAPADGPFFDDPQPMFGIDVRGVGPGGVMVVDDRATSFPCKPGELPPGAYAAQAVLDLHRLHSGWKREPGNLFSEVVRFDVGADRAAPAPVDLRLTQRVEPRPLPAVAGVDVFQVRSALLSEFHGREVVLRAGVVRPREHDPERRYAAVYEVPGFGGDHTDAFGVFGRRLHAREGTPEWDLAGEAFWIVLDPEGPNGHHLFADSASNGPVGRALVEELIPALEARYNLAPERAARLLRGHSSGGWSAVWLAITYPDVFGAAWATSPDPVDFRRFQLIDLYRQDSMYEVGQLDAIDKRFREPGTLVEQSRMPDDAWLVGSYRQDGQVRMTVRQENLMEEVLGPGNTSGQQWDSWQAVFGPRGEDGRPAALFDPATGAIDRAIAERYRAYDIADRVRGDAGLALIFRQRIRLLVGDEDNFYLHQAVARLKEEVEKIQFIDFPEGEHGYIKVLEGYDHGSIAAAPEFLALPGEMLEHLRRHGHAGAR